MSSIVVAGVVVVLYEPDDSDVFHVLELSASAVDLVVVDNSPEPALACHAILSAHGLEVLFMGNKAGLAGAYNAGVENLAVRGCTHFFLLDQDSRLPENFFSDMVAAAESLIEKPFLLAPNAYETQTRRMMPVFPLARGLPLPQVVQGGRLVPLLFAVSTGTLMSVSAYRELGPFREDFFIEYVDVEYGLRANRLGVPVLLHPGLSLLQRAGQSQRHGRSFSTNYPAWRRYYRARNCAITLREHGHVVFSVPINLADVLRIIRFESGKRTKLRAVFLGWLDGLRGRTGALPALRGADAQRWGHPG